jgi:hypothetical protein
VTTNVFEPESNNIHRGSVVQSENGKELRKLRAAVWALDVLAQCHWLSSTTRERALVFKTQLERELMALEQANDLAKGAAASSDSDGEAA